MNNSTFPFILVFILILIDLGNGSQFGNSGGHCARSVSLFTFLFSVQIFEILICAQWKVMEMYRSFRNWNMANHWPYNTGRDGLYIESLNLLKMERSNLFCRRTHIKEFDKWGDICIHEKETWEIKRGKRAHWPIDISPTVNLTWYIYNTRRELDDVRIYFIIICHRSTHQSVSLEEKKRKKPVHLLSIKNFILL
jgi:hypothetical protein